MELIPGAAIGEKYELERALASGGMGSIWVARHTALNVKVAIKFIGAAYADSPMLRTRFVREARAAAQIASNHVVHVHDFGVWNDTPYLVMELLEGEDLGVRLKRERTLPLDVIGRIFTQVAKGLRRAHKAGFVHRDLKPSNIFLARSGDEEDEEEVVKILDFGVAKQTIAAPLDESTKTGEIMGSPHYMSPEQIQETKGIDARSDLWSLAVILFRAVTGELPFPGEATGHVMAKILTDPIPRASQFKAELPSAMDEFFWRAFQRDPDYRFQSVREMAEAFAAAIGGHSSARVSWTFLGTPTGSRFAPTLPPPTSFSLSPPSSTIPAMFALDETLQSADRASPVNSSPLAGMPLLEATRASQSFQHSETLLASCHPTPLPRSRRARRPLFGWALGAVSIGGLVAGWGLIGLLMGPASASAAQRAQGVVYTPLMPLAPAVAIVAPSEAVPTGTVTGPTAVPANNAQVGGAVGLEGQPSAPASANAGSEPGLRAGTVTHPATPVAPSTRAQRQARRAPRLGF